MFTGIIEAVGTMRSVTRHGEDARVCIDTGELDLGDVKIGDSIAVSGVCLTVTALANGAFDADLSGETLARTTFRDRGVGDRLNLEKSVTLAQRLGGHLVSGHVDGVGRVSARTNDGRSIVLTFEVPTALGRYIVEKGSICVDGVSLTVNEVSDRHFTVSIVPHTRSRTTLEDLRVGSAVNLEVDLIARYVEGLFGGEQGSRTGAAPRT